MWRGGVNFFASSLCDELDIHTYDIADNNAFAVDLFNKTKRGAKNSTGFLINLLEDNLLIKKQYDFVYSIGLIEHFRGKDIETIIKRHFDFLKDDGFVLLSFSTPTKKYRFTRKLLEILHLWQFWDEVPLCYEDVAPFVEKYGTCVEFFLNKKLPLSQLVIIAKKNSSKKNVEQ